MKKIATSLIALALCAIVAAPAFAGPSNVRISQIFPGGGSSAGTWIYDWVELFNPTGSPVNIGGWSLQYGSATGTSFGSTAANMVVFPTNATIPACGYYLVQIGSAGTGGVALPIAPDLVSANINMQASNGKIALINNATGGNLCSGNTSGPIYVDVFGYGTGNCFETVAAAATSNTTYAVRAGGGMIDGDNNSTDFSVVSTAGAVLRNSSSVSNPDCLTTPASSQTWGRIKTIYR